MKRTLLGISLSSLLVIATCAHAEDSVPMQMPMSADSQQTGGTANPAMQPGSSDQGGTISGTSASGQGSAGLTRSEVKQQLLTAEQDGELKRLNQTLYKGQ
jgi:hypothetical protein